jgi:adenylate cyclase
MPQSRQLAAIMFTDIVGYTALMGNDEQKAFELLNKNRQIQKPIIEEYNGRWIKELGDGVMASFNTVSDAVGAAIKIQQICNAAKDFQLRIGIHLGEVVFENDDVFGDGVNIAARIQALATPGGIWISEPVHHNVVNKNNIDSEFVKVEHLKNVKEPVRIYQVIAAGVVSTKPVHSFAGKVNAAGNKTVKLRKTALVFSVAVLIVVAGYFIYSHFQQIKERNALINGEVIDKSIAVLPFLDLSPAKDQGYLGDGLADEIINSITAINNLKVIGRTSSFQYKGQELNAQTIGEKLNVSNVLAGSIQKSGDDLRITVSLIRVKDNVNIFFLYRIVLLPTLFKN